MNHTCSNYTLLIHSLCEPSLVIQTQQIQAVLVDLCSDSPSVGLNPHVEPRASNLWNKYTFRCSRTTVWHDCVRLTDNWSLRDGGRTSGTAQSLQPACKTQKKLAGVSQQLWTVHNTHRSAWSTFHICNLSWQQVIKRMRRCWIDQQWARRCFPSNRVWYALHRCAIICQPLLLW